MNNIGPTIKFTGPLERLTLLEYGCTNLKYCLIWTGLASVELIYNIKNVL